MNHYNFKNGPVGIGIDAWTEKEAWKLLENIVGDTTGWTLT